MAISWNEENAAHLLRRAGFGATSFEIKRALALGLTKTVQSLFKPDGASDKLPKGIDSLERLQAWWMLRMIRTKRPLREKLALFWHNHFATGIQKVESLDEMHRQNRTFRALGFGKFRDLTLGVSKGAAMIVWLDSETNVVGNPNQNFARELMELFTTGVLDKNGNPNYTEMDVEEGARAFTGWQRDGWKFYFNEEDHDSGVKTFKGHTGAWGGEDIIGFLTAEDATARRLAMKLFSFFAYEVGLSDPVLDPLVAAYLQNDTEIRPMLELLFTSDVFYTVPAKRSHILGPVEFVVSATRQLRAKVTPPADDLGYFTQEMGQSLFAPPSVFGWKEGLPWLSTAGVRSRAQVGTWLATGRDSRNPVHYKPAALIGSGWKGLGPEQIVDRLLAALGLPDAAPTTRAALATYLQLGSDGNPTEFENNAEFLDSKVRGAVALILSTPEYQLS